MTSVVTQYRQGFYRNFCKTLRHLCYHGVLYLLTTNVTLLTILPYFKRGREGAELPPCYFFLK